MKSVCQRRPHLTWGEGRYRERVAERLERATAQTGWEPPAAAARDCSAAARFSPSLGMFASATASAVRGVVALPGMGRRRPPGVGGVVFRLGCGEAADTGGKVNGMDEEFACPPDIPDYLFEAMPLSVRALVAEVGVAALRERLLRNPERPLLVNEDGRALCLVCGMPLVRGFGTGLHPLLTPEEGEHHERVADRLERAIKRANAEESSN